MPLYEYTCESCGYEFEELVGKSDDSITMECSKCGATAKRLVSSFSSVINGSDNESVDRKIGIEAEKRWKMVNDRQDKRRKDKNLKEIKLPKREGAFAPAMVLGDKNEKGKRKEYSTALQKHRQERERKGQPQFTEAGSF